ncbi:hypothetical protein CQW39_13365 [Streptomyces griseofuscus]|nr:hypothetical protein CQW39_13365 [Streptomyces griseofuscus]
MTADSCSPGADRKDLRKTGNASGACLGRRPPRTCPGQEGDRRSGASREERLVTPIVNGLGCRYGTVPPLIQDGDPQALTREVGEELDGWQAWSEPVPGWGCLWAASFSSSVPHDLVAAFARSVSSTAPVLRRVLPDSTRDQPLRAPVT